MAALGFPGEVTRAQDYRTFFTNTFSLQFNGSELLIKCGIVKDAANPMAGVDEQCSLAMSPVSAKALMLTLKTMLDQAELAGQTIPVAPELTERLNKIAEDYTREMTKAKKST